MKQNNKKSVGNVCMAIKELSDSGIDVLSVNFRKSSPLILVDSSKRLKRFRSALSGQGVRHGQRYLKRSAVLFGCQVDWRELV